MFRFDRRRKGTKETTESRRTRTTKINVREREIKSNINGNFDTVWKRATGCKKSGKVKKWKTRGIERSLKKKFNVSEVLEKKRLANIATDRASSM